MDTTVVSILALLLVVTTVHTFEELPKFSQLLLLYPGYHKYGGSFRDADIPALVGADEATTEDRLNALHNTAPLRLSLTLNRYGGRHSLPTEPVLLSKKGRDSVTGRDGREYIFRHTAFGPYLAEKYGNPEYVKASEKNRDTETGEVVGLLQRFQQRQGIIRLVNYNHRHPAGHVGLWDCDHFVQSRDWSHDPQLIAVEFWEASDSYCPPAPEAAVTPNMATAPLDLSNVQLVVRHNYPQSPAQSSSSSARRLHRRHHRRRSNGKVPEQMWLQ